MKTLVTGASGFLGREVAARFRQQGDVVALGHTQTRAGELACDLRDPEALNNLLRREAPDCVVHCAAYRDPDFCEDHPEEAWRLNVDPVRLMCERLPAPVAFVQISTDYVFDGETPPYSENSPRRPVNTYGETKAAAEDIVLRRAGSLILRMPLLVGAGLDELRSGVISQLYTQLLNPAPQDVDHGILRFPTWIGDVAEALAFLLERRATGVFHISSRQPLTRYDCIQVVACVAQRSSAQFHPLRTPELRSARRPHNSQLSTTALRALGFHETASFESVVREVLSRFSLLPESKGGS